MMTGPWRDRLAGASALAAVLLLVGPPTSAAAQESADSCVGCHTDAGKLKALTPPDPPSAETGEG